MMYSKRIWRLFIILGGNSMKIQHTSPVPLYYQLREQIRSKILNGELKYGDQLPSETELCETLNLSRSTIKHAFDGLVSDDFIVRIQGKGTFVSYRNLSYDILNEPNFYAQKDKEGSKQWSRILEARNLKCDELVAKRLNIDVGDKVCYFRRVRYIDNIPSIIQTVYIKEEYAHDIINKDLANLSFHRFIEEKNKISLNLIKIKINSIILDNYEMELFDIKQTKPGFLFDTIYTYNNEPIIYNERIFRGDHITLLLKYNSAELKGFSSIFEFIDDI